MWLSLKILGELPEAFTTRSLLSELQPITKGTFRDGAGNEEHWQQAQLAEAQLYGIC